MQLLIATANAKKLFEIRPLLAGASVELVTLADLPPVSAPAEAGTTFWANAREKALAYARHSGLTTVAEDSGLEIAALHGAPGVRSGRFLGEGVSYPERFEEIYRRLAAAGTAERRARFVTALAVARANELLFETEASVEGRIADAPAGVHGFGYDPIFLYPPFGRTTAELTTAQKSAVSHRARAIRDLGRWLRAEVRAAQVPAKIPADAGSSSTDTI